jgi:hypothetical protein
MPKYGERGEFIIEAESGTKRSTNGVRTVPMEPLAMEPIRAYIRLAVRHTPGQGMSPCFSRMMAAVQPRGLGPNGATVAAANPSGRHRVQTAPTAVDLRPPAA